jgi:preprotein translocase subunit SecA
MFSFFSKKQPPKSKDLIWISKNAKFNALIKAIHQKQLTEIVIVVSHFEETKAEMANIMTQAQVQFKEIKYLSEFQSDVSVYLVGTSAFYSAPGYSLLGDKLNSNAVEIVIAEHYPLKKADELLLTKILEQFPANNIEYYLSLDDDFFTQIGNERLIQLMSQMGMKEDEMIEHTLISQSIVKYQEKLAGMVKTEKPAPSMKEWFRVNGVLK